MKKLIEQKEENSKLVFLGEVKSLEFTENIGEKENSPKPKERDIELKKIGKKLFKKHPLRKNTFSIRLRYYPEILSREEIDSLLTSDKERYVKYKKMWSWELDITFKKKIYTIRFPFFRKYSFILEPPPKPSPDHSINVLSEEEIMQLLPPIKDVTKKGKILSKMEIEWLLTATDKEVESSFTKKITFVWKNKKWITDHIRTKILKNINGF